MTVITKPPASPVDTYLDGYQLVEDLGRWFGEVTGRPSEVEFVAAHKENGELYFQIGNVGLTVKLSTVQPATSGWFIVDIAARAVFHDGGRSTRSGFVKISPGENAYNSPTTIAAFNRALENAENVGVIPGRPQPAGIEPVFKSDLKPERIVTPIELYLAPIGYAPVPA